MHILLKLKVTALAALGLFLAQPALAEDLVIQDQTINDTQTFDSAEGIVFDNVVATPPANVRAVATYEIVLKPGTRIEAGAYFVAENRDHDGLPNRWEMDNCQTLDHSAADDPDSDGLTMSTELQHNTHPCNADTDGDGMPDGWEVQHGFNPLVNDADGDADGDGLSNLGEYQAGTDPHNSDTDGDGMPDGWEVQFGLNPLVDDAQGDADGDGVSNRIEYLKGTDPSDGQSTPLYFQLEYDANGNLKNMQRPQSQ